MESVLERLEQGSRLAILRLRSLGDCVLTTPAIEILKRSRPDLRIAVAVENRFRALFERNSDVDEILPAERGAVRSWRPELCLNLHGGSRSAWITMNSGARYRAGFAHFRHQRVYNVRIPRAQEILGVDRKVHTAEHLASAMFYLGAERIEIPRAKLAALPNPPGTPIPIAVIHPFAAAAAKTWMAEGFLEVAAQLKRSGMHPIFIGGAADDFSPFRDFQTIRDAPLSEIKQLLSRSSLFLGNDSGPAHMAAAFGLPVVVIFAASDPEIWGPWRTPSQVLTGGDMASITTSQVIDAVSRLKVHA